MCSLVGLGEGFSFPSLSAGLHLERERHLLSCLCQEGLGEPEELLELKLGNMLELPEQLDAEDELEPLMETVLVLEPRLEAELDRDLKLLLPLKVLCLFDFYLCRDITLPTKVHLVKAMVFPVVMYRCESWTIKKAEHQRIDAFKLWC